MPKLIDQLRRRFGAPAIAGAALVALSACTIPSGMPKPAIEVPDTFEAASIPSPSVWPTPDWWRGFGSAELNDLMARAQAANLDMVVAAARVQQADAQARIAGAGLLPTLDLTSDASRQKASGALTRPARNGRYSTEFTALLNASYEVDFWGKNRAASESAQQSALASRFDQQIVALSTVAGVANTYFQIVALQDRLKIARENLASAEDILRAIQSRVQFGTASGLDTAQEESLVAQQRAAIPPLEQQLQINTNALAILLGQLPEKTQIAGGTLTDIAVPIVGAGLPSELLARRPDVREAEARLAAANANVQVARAAFLPSISLTAQGGYESIALRTLFSPMATAFGIVAGLTQPIFSGGNLEGQLALQKAVYEELVATYRKYTLSAFQDVENALVTNRQTAEQERLEQLAVAAARRAYEISEAQFRQGTIDIVTLLNTQRTLFQETDILAQVRLAHLQALTSLFQALGGGWTQADIKSP